MVIAPPDPPLSDEILSLRPWHLDDAPAVTAACQDPEMIRWLTVPTPYSENDARDFITAMTRPELENTVALAITGPEGVLVGSLTMWIVRPEVVEFGYWTAPQVRGRGYMARSVRLLARWAVDELRPRRLQLGTFPGNRASERVAEKLGFVREGVLRSYSEQRGEPRDIVMWSLLPAELR